MNSLAARFARCFNNLTDVQIGRPRGFTLGGGERIGKIGQPDPERGAIHLVKPQHRLDTQRPTRPNDSTGDLATVCYKDF